MKPGDLVQLKESVQRWFTRDYRGVAMLITDIYATELGQTDEEQTIVVAYAECGVRLFDLKDIERID